MSINLTYIGHQKDPQGIHARMVGQNYYHFTPSADVEDVDAQGLLRTGVFKRTEVEVAELADEPAEPAEARPAPKLRKPAREKVENPVDLDSLTAALV